MAEYVELEAVLKIIDDNCPHDKGGYNTEEEMGAGAACYYIRKAVNDIPTAYVTSSAKVAMEIFDEIEDALESCYDPDIHADYPSPCYNLWLADRIAELKKKYMEEKK